MRLVLHLEAKNTTEPAIYREFEEVKNWPALNEIVMYGSNNYKVTTIAHELGHGHVIHVYAKEA
jgi:hypothetical protein